MDGPAPTAPPVVAVVVAHRPGDWFAEVLAGLADQDYPNLSVLVLDASDDDEALAGRVRAQLPEALVRRVGGNPGYGATANHALDLVQGGSFFCFLHDDVALDSSCVRLLVEEAYRSNAGVIGPKLVDWDDPGRLLQVGDAVDKGGVLAPYVERGELDQEQHDAVRDVFSVPGGCTLVRADLFRALGGYDPAITFHGDDVDLCWRAHVAGARVMVDPSAWARHREAMPGRRPDDRRRLLARHRLRTVLTAYGPVQRLRVLPQLVVLGLVEVLYALLVGRTGQARDVAGAWPWNIRRLGRIRANRKRLNAVRQVPDNEVRRLQVRGSARLTAFARGQIGHGADRRTTVAAAGRSLFGSVRTRSRQAELLAVAVLAVVLVAGSRHLVSRSVPVVGELAAFPSSPWTLLRDFASGWRPVGLGTTDAAPTATALLGLAGLASFGAMALLRTMLVVLPLAVGWIGAYRMARPLGPGRARLAAMVVYAALPLPYNALAGGRWSGLALYAAAPWVLARLARASRLAPFGPVRGEPAPGLPRRGLVAQVMALGLLSAVLMAFVPLAPALVLGAAVALALASLLVGGAPAAGRAVGVAAGAVVVAAALNLPWSADLLRPDGAWSALGSVRPAGAGGTALGDLLRFETGPLGGGPVGWAFLVVAAVPLLLGRDWRLAWAARAWGVALASFGLAWAGERSWIEVGLPGPEVLLAFAGAALAMAAGLGASAFEADLRGHRFGWRQVVSGVAVAAAALAALPVLGMAAGGRWDLPRNDTPRALRFLEDADEGPFRVLWLGDPRTLPLDGWWLRDGLAYGLSENGLPDVRGQWTGTPSTATAMVPSALNVAADDLTERLGRLLAPMGVRYVVVPRSDAPGIYGRAVREVPASLTTMLASQLDLERVPVDDALVVYRNVAWMPSRAALDPAGVEASRRSGLDAAVAADLSGSTAALDGERTTSVDGELAPGTELYLATATSGRWRLTVDERTVPGRTAFGWANAWSVPEGGRAELDYRTPRTRLVLVAAQALAWLAVAQVVLRAVSQGHEAATVPAYRVRARRRRRAGAPDPVTGPDPGVVPGVPPVVAPGWPSEPPPEGDDLPQDLDLADDLDLAGDLDLPDDLELPEDPDPWDLAAAEDLDLSRPDPARDERPDHHEEAEAEPADPPFAEPADAPDDTDDGTGFAEAWAAGPDEDELDDGTWAARAEEVLDEPELRWGPPEAEPEDDR